MQEPNRNRKPEPSELFFTETESEPELWLITKGVFSLETSLGPATTQNLAVKFDGEICGGVVVKNASDDFPQQKKLEDLLPNFVGSSPPISPKTSPTSLWRSLLEPSLESLKSLKSLESVENGQVLPCFPHFKSNRISRIS